MRTNPDARSYMRTGHRNGSTAAVVEKKSTTYGHDYTQSCNARSSGFGREVGRQALHASGTWPTPLRDGGGWGRPTAAHNLTGHRARRLKRTAPRHHTKPQSPRRGVTATTPARAYPSWPASQRTVKAAPLTCCRCHASQPQGPRQCPTKLPQPHQPGPRQSGHL